MAQVMYPGKRRPTRPGGIADAPVDERAGGQKLKAHGQRLTP